MPKIEFEEATSTFLLTTDNGEVIPYRYYPDRKNVWENLKDEDFEVVLLNNPFLHREMDVFEVRFDGSDERGGFLFPVTILESEEAEGKQLLSYMLVAYRILLSRLKSNLTGVLSDSFRDAFVLVVHKSTVPNFLVTDYLFSLASNGYYRYQGKVKDKFPSLQVIQGHTKAIKLSRKEIDNTIVGYVKELVEIRLCTASDFLTRFILVYQIVELYISEIRRGRAIMSGGDYGVDYFNAAKLEEIASDINNIWYYHDKMHPCRLGWQARIRGTEELIKKELREISPLYLQEDMNVAMVAKVSGEFYTDVYQPIEYETYRHEAYVNQYRRHTVAVWASVSFVLLLLSLMLFVKLPVLLLQTTTFIVILMLIGSLLMLAVDIKSQIKWWNRVEESIEKNKAKNLDMVKILRNVKNTCNAIFSALLSKMVVAGLLLSIWAVFSVEIPWIPKIMVTWETTTVAGWNKLFLALAYSYIAGVILYWFTVKFPFAINKRRLKPVIDSKISSIGNQLLNMSLEFRNLENPQVTEVDTIMGLITTKRWTEACKVPYHARRSNVTEAFVYDYYEVRQSVSSLISDYKMFLSAEQLILLEELRESQVNAFFSVAEGQGQGFVFSDYFYEQVMKPAYRKLLEDYNRLAESR